MTLLCLTNPSSIFWQKFVPEDLKENEKKLANRVIPNVMNERKMFPNIDPKMHLYIFNKELWGIKIPSRSDAREVDFEEDEWIHENQYVLDEAGHQWPEKLFEFKDIGAGESDPELKIAEKEEMIIQNIF